MFYFRTERERREITGDYRYRSNKSCLDRKSYKIVLTSERIIEDRWYNGTSQKVHVLTLYKMEGPNVLPMSKFHRIVVKKMKITIKDKENPEEVIRSRYDYVFRFSILH